MLDRYWSGSVTRRSPEAPVPVVNVYSQENKHGGAGNVASMLSDFRAPLKVWTSFASDNAGELVNNLLTGRKIDFDNFEKINQFVTFDENKTINKNTGVIKTKTNYTANDVDAFDQIIKSKADIKKHSEDKVNSKVDNKKIKIIDFNKLKEREKILKNKVGIEKIKIVYFD